MSEPVTFGPFRLEPADSRLERDGVRVELRRQAISALAVLLRHTGHFVDYDTMIREGWGGAVVSRHTVAVTIGEVKRALGEIGHWIAYRPRLGYRLEVPRSEDLIRQANHFWGRMNREGLEKALLYFRQASEQDSSDARALAGMAAAYLTLGTFGMRSAPEMYRGFLEAHARAVAVGGPTPELQSELAHALHVFERRIAEARELLTQAHRERPGAGLVSLRLAMLLATSGQFDEALVALDQAEAAEPLHPTFRPARVFILLCRGEHHAAVRVATEAVDLHPLMPLGRALYADALALAGNREEALKQYRHACYLSPDLPWLHAMEGAVLAKLGRNGEALAILEEMEQLREVEYVDAYFMTLLLGALELPEAAYQELNRALEENSATLFLLDVDPRMDTLRADPRFTRVRDQVFAQAASPGRCRAAG